MKRVSALKHTYKPKAAILVGPEAEAQLDKLKKQGERVVLG
ncbi:MAG: hypothetical protein RIA69_19450 [Cyclobacteriaceae bacterium]